MFSGCVRPIRPDIGGPRIGRPVKTQGGSRSLVPRYYARSFGHEVSSIRSSPPMSVNSSVNSYLRLALCQPQNAGVRFERVAPESPRSPFPNSCTRAPNNSPVLLTSLSAGVARAPPVVCDWNHATSCCNPLTCMTPLLATARVARRATFVGRHCSARVERMDGAGPSCSAAMESWAVRGLDCCFFARNRRIGCSCRELPHCQHCDAPCAHMRLLRKDMNMAQIWVNVPQIDR